MPVFLTASVFLVVRSFLFTALAQMPFFISARRMTARFSVMSTFLYVSVFLCMSRLPSISVFFTRMSTDFAMFVHLFRVSRMSTFFFFIHLVTLSVTLICIPQFSTLFAVLFLSFFLAFPFFRIRWIASSVVLCLGVFLDHFFAVFWWRTSASFSFFLLLLLAASLCVHFFSFKSI